jgi:putative two-component system response regulator
VQYIERLVNASERPAVNADTILIVDDTPENLDVLSEILLPHYHVRAANGGTRALDIARGEQRPDLILLDVMMPEMDGYEVLQQLRRDVATQAIPVIFVTALDTDNDEAIGLNAGAVDYITKPVRPAVVLARVRAHLELARAREALRSRNAWLDTEVRRRMYQNLAMQDVVLRALACLAEARDHETGRHLLRTQRYVRGLAEELSSLPRFVDYLTPDRIDLYVKAAPLHDIGKVGIPDSILLKPGKLTPDEWTVMRSHPSIGAEAIRRAVAEQPDTSGLEFLEVAAEIANFHHEKWDGSGYPAGLAGERIPLCARLMALADVFDALTSKRVYKEKFDLERSAAIICEGRGTHFDPDVVDAFVARKDEFRRIALELSDHVP